MCSDDSFFPLFLQDLTGLNVYPQGSLFQSMVGEPWWVGTVFHVFVVIFIGDSIGIPRIVNFTNLNHQATNNNWPDTCNTLQDSMFFFCRWGLVSTDLQKMCSSHRMSPNFEVNNSKKKSLKPPALWVYHNQSKHTWKSYVVDVPSTGKNPRSPGKNQQGSSHPTTVVLRLVADR